MRMLGNVIKNIIGSWAITDPNGWTWGAPTGGAQGASTINVAGGLFVNGTSVANPFLTAKVKAATTSRASTTVLAADPDLVSASLAPGTYSVELSVVWSETGGASQGISFNLTNTGTMVQQLYALTATSTTTGLSAASLLVPGAGSLGNITNAYNTGAGTGATILLIKGTALVTVAGVLTFNWAQQVSNASATNVLSGSYLNIQKIA